MPAEAASEPGESTLFTQSFDDAWSEFEEPANLLAEDHLSLRTADSDGDNPANAVDEALLSMLDLINLQ